MADASNTSAFVEFERVQKSYDGENLVVKDLNLTMLQNGLDVSRVITHRFDVEDFAEGFAAMKSGRSGKVVLRWP